MTDTVAAHTHTMRAIVQDRYGESDVLRLEQIPRPVIGDNEVLLRVHAAAVGDPSHDSPGDRPGRGRALWSSAWPKLAAVAMALVVWELVVLSGWRPEYVLPGPGAVLGRLWTDLLAGDIGVAAAITMKRAVIGYAIALVAGVSLGLVLARVKVLRTAAGSLLTGLQTMPSVAWFPLAILLFQLSEAAILAVVVLGAAPSIAIGLLTSTDQVPPLLVRAGRVLGARPEPITNRNRP